VSGNLEFFNLSVSNRSTRVSGTILEQRTRRPVGVLAGHASDHWESFALTEKGDSWVKLLLSP
jgi:hypothetical protein